MVAVEVVRDTERGVWIGLAVRLVGIRPAIVVVVEVGVVTDPVAIVVVPLGAVEWEGVTDVRD